MNECRIIEDLLPLYTDGLLQEDTTEFVKLHLVRCTACSEKERQLKAVVDVPPPAPKTDKKSRFRRVGRKKRIKAFLISAACCVLAVGLFFASYAVYQTLRQNRLEYEIALEYVQQMSRQTFPEWNIPEGTGEGIRAENDSLVMYLPDVGFGRVEEGYYVRYINVPEYETSYPTSSIRFSEENLEEIDFYALKNTSRAQLRCRDYYKRGYELFLDLKITNQLELAYYLFDFDLTSIDENSSKDELALGVFVAVNYSYAFQRRQAIRLTGKFSGYVLFKDVHDPVAGVQDSVLFKETREWVIYIENPTNTNTVYNIQITNVDPVFSPHSRWLCTDYTVRDILSNVQIL